MLSATAYLWLKALHIVSVIAWMAGLLYLPRLFVYHAQAEPGSAASETFKIMERRLMKAIMTPAMVASAVFGGLLLMQLDRAAWADGWIHAKLAGVAGLLLAHACMEGWRRAFACDANGHSAKFFRIVNELPTLLMIAVVIFAVVKPF